MDMVKRLVTILVALTLSVLGLGQGKPFTLIDRVIPAFSVNNVDGTPITSQSLAGHPTVMFDFCSCGPCHRVAKEWARNQRFPKNPHREATLVVFSGSPDQAKEFADETNLDPKVTTVASDAELTLARRLHAAPCPTVFVVDAGGVVRYSSKEMARLNETSPSVLIGQAVSMLAVYGSSSDPVPSKGTLPAAVAHGPSLTPVKETDEDYVKDNGLVWANGDVKSTHVTREFTFRNDTKQPIHIDRLGASCGCGKADLLQFGKSVTSADVQPGETIKVVVTVDLADGPQTKIVFVWLYSESLNPVAYIKISLSKDLAVKICRTSV